MSPFIEFVYPGCWHFVGATSKIDDVLIDHGRLLYVLPLSVHLKFGDRSNNFLLFEFSVGHLLHV